MSTRKLILPGRQFLFLLAFSAIGLQAHAQTITEIIDLHSAEGVTVDDLGNVYVTSGFLDKAFKIATPGTCSTGGTPCTITEIISGTVDGPLDVAVDGSGNVYVLGTHNDAVSRVTPGGVETKIIDALGDLGGNILTQPEGVAVDGSGNVYVTGNSSHNAFKIATPGTCKTSGGTACAITKIIDATGAGGADTLDTPLAVAVDGSHNVYVTGNTSWNAFKISPPDEDGDGVGDDLDICAGTVIPETSVPSKRLGENRWALVDGDLDFDTKAPKGDGPKRSYNTTDTGGCSCEQIIAEQRLGEGNVKHGCYGGAMHEWVKIVNSLGKRGAGSEADAVQPEVPDEFALDASYPNPFNPSTRIEYALPENAFVRLTVFDALGRTVAELVNGQLPVGRHSVVWDAKGMASGVYFYRLKAGSFVKTKSMFLAQ